MNRLQRKKLSRIYEESRHALSALVKKFTKRYGGEEDENYGEACLLLIKAWESWEVEKGDFKKRLFYVVWRGLLDIRKKDMLRGATLKKVPLLDFQERVKNFSVSEFKDCLSPEASFVVESALRPPLKVRALIEEKESDHGRTVRSCIRKFLLGLGWSLGQIMEVFNEIKQALR